MTATRPKLETDRSLRSSVIRLAHAQPDLRPHLLPLLKQADSAEDDEEVEAALLWRRKYERDYDSVLQAYLDKYVSALDEMKSLLRFWFFTRNGNFRDTPFAELPNIAGMKSALFHRRKKMLWDLNKEKSSLDWNEDEMLNKLDSIIDAYDRDFSAR